MKANGNGTTFLWNDATNGPSTGSDSTQANGSYGTTYNTSLKSVFVTFEKARAPLAVIQNLSAANFFVALRPGTQTTDHYKVVEVLVPITTTNGSIQTSLQGSFADVTAVTSDCNVYRVAVPSLCFKQVHDALRSCTFKVGGLNGIINGQAFFTAYASVNVTPSQIAAALEDAQIEATFLELMTDGSKPEDTWGGLQQALASPASPISRTLAAMDIAPATFASFYANFSGLTWNQTTATWNHSIDTRPAVSTDGSNGADEFAAASATPQFASV